MLIAAAITLGLPMLAFAWYMFDSLLEQGELDKDHVGEQLKALKKRQKSEDKEEGGLLTARWMKFGGGFYGLAALYTFVIIEVSELIDFLLNFPGLDILLADGIIALVLNALLNQLMNFVSAMIWFVYWGDGSRVLANMAIAYTGYYAGMQLALHDTVRRWLDTSD